MTGVDNLQRLAHKYANHWPIFPVVGKAPHGALAPTGFKNATTDDATITSWFANGSPPTGIAFEPATAGLLVVDVDRHHDGHDGFESLAQLEQRLGVLPLTATVITPGGGEHRYLRMPKDVVVASRNQAFGDAFPGVDVKSSGGYVVLPPSLHPEGGIYVWDAAGAEIAGVPSAWLSALLEAKRHAPIPGVDDDAPIPSGTRHDTLVRWAGRMRHIGMDAAAIEREIAATNARRCDPPLPDDEVSAIASSVARYEPAMPPVQPREKTVDAKAPKLLVTRADRVPVVRVEWLAPDRIPLGGLTLFDGPGGIGKTTFLTGLIAAASVGRDFFTGNGIEPVSSLIVGVEDRRTLIVQRMRTCGADMRRVHFVDAAQIGDRNVPLVLPDHVGILEGAIVEHDVGFVYVDALFSHISLDGEGRMAQQVRAALQPIGEMCERRNAAFAAMRHWTKSTGPALSRALGSVEFTNVARSVFTFGRHPNDDSLSVCAHTKSNYAPLTEAVGFRLQAHDVVDDNGRPSTIAIAADLGIVEGVSSDDLTMRAPADPDERGGAAEWLRDHLADGAEHLASEVFEAAKKAAAGSRVTLSRAARSIGVSMGRTASYPSVGTWTLPTASEQKRVSVSPSANAGAPQKLTQQGSASRITVVSSDGSNTADDTTATTETTGPAPPKAREPKGGLQDAEMWSLE